MNLDVLLASAPHWVYSTDYWFPDGDVLVLAGDLSAITCPSSYYYDSLDGEDDGNSDSWSTFTTVEQLSTSPDDTFSRSSSCTNNPRRGIIAFKLHRNILSRASPIWADILDQHSCNKLPFDLLPEPFNLRPNPTTHNENSNSGNTNNDDVAFSHNDNVGTGTKCAPDPGPERNEPVPYSGPGLGLGPDAVFVSRSLEMKPRHRDDAGAGCEDSSKSGLSVLRLDDDPVDVFHLVRALYDGLYPRTENEEKLSPNSEHDHATTTKTKVTNPPTPLTEFTSLASVLRLSRKYEMETVYNCAIGQLVRGWPVGLKAWDEEGVMWFGGGSTVLGNEREGSRWKVYPHPIHIINLVRELGVGLGLGLGGSMPSPGSYSTSETDTTNPETEPDAGGTGTVTRMEIQSNVLVWALYELARMRASEIVKGAEPLPVLDLSSLGVGMGLLGKGAAGIKTKLGICEEGLSERVTAEEDVVVSGGDNGVDVREGGRGGDRGTSEFQDRANYSVAPALDPTRRVHLSHADLVLVLDAKERLGEYLSDFIRIVVDKRMMANHCDGLKKDNCTRAFRTLAEALLRRVVGCCAAAVVVVDVEARTHFGSRLGREGELCAAETKEDATRSKEVNENRNRNRLAVNGIVGDSDGCSGGGDCGCDPLTVLQIALEEMSTGMLRFGSLRRWACVGCREEFRYEVLQARQRCWEDMHHWFGLGLGLGMMMDDMNMDMDMYI